jgi:Arc/MetJ family transcription regulator
VIVLLVGLGVVLAPRMSVNRYGVIAAAAGLVVVIAAWVPTSAHPDTVRTTDRPGRNPPGVSGVRGNTGEASPQARAARRERPAAVEGGAPEMILSRLRRVIFKAVGDGRPYPDHGYTTAKQWSKVAPRQVRLDELVTTKRTLDLAQLLSEDSTFYGDLFAHVVQWRDTMYLEDGLHRAVRAALAQRPVLHARVLVLAD